MANTYKTKWRLHAITLFQVPCNNYLTHPAWSPVTTPNLKTTIWTFKFWHVTLWHSSKHPQFKSSGMLCRCCWVKNSTHPNHTVIPENLKSFQSSLTVRKTCNKSNFKNWHFVLHSRSLNFWIGVFKMWNNKKQSTLLFLRNCCFTYLFICSKFGSYFAFILIKLCRKYSQHIQNCCSITNQINSNYLHRQNIKYQKT